MRLKNIFLFIFFLSSLLKFPCFSQFFDYHREESPAISWNGVTLFDAIIMSTGGISLLSSIPFAAAVNPALITKNKNISVGASIETMSHMAFQYWGINEGVLKAPEGLDEKNIYFSGFSLTMPLKKIFLSFGWYLSNILEYPDFGETEEYWQYTGIFSGKENNFFVAVAFRLGKKFSLGLKLEYITGKRLVDITETFLYSGGWYSIIQQKEKHNSTSISSSLGAIFKISSSWEMGAVLTYPLHGSVKRTVYRKFENNFPSPDISDEQNCTDDVYQPVKIRLGTIFALLDKKQSNYSKRIILAAEVLYVLWSQYRYVFFSEILEREMRNTIVVAMGMEYGFFQKKYDYFLRIGYRLDPQPLTEPNTTLHSFCGGIGFRWKRFFGDFGLTYFFGSSGDIEQNHFVACATFGYSFKGE